LQQRTSVYRQPLTKVKGTNIYSYLRSNDGPGLECLALAFPLN